MSPNNILQMRLARELGQYVQVSQTNGFRHASSTSIQYIALTSKLALAEFEIVGISQ